LFRNECNFAGKVDLEKHSTEAEYIVGNELELKELDSAINLESKNGVTVLLNARAFQTSTGEQRIHAKVTVTGTEQAAQVPPLAINLPLDTTGFTYSGACDDPSDVGTYSVHLAIRDTD